MLKKNKIKKKIRIRKIKAAFCTNFLQCCIINCITAHSILLDPSQYFVQGKKREDGNFNTLDFLLILIKGTLTIFISGSRSIVPNFKVGNAKNSLLKWVNKIKLRMDERAIWKEHISFPQVQEHLYTGGRRTWGSQVKKLSQAGKQDIKSTFRSSIH